MEWTIPQLALRRRPEEDEPHLANVELFACNREISVRADLFISPEQFVEIGGVFQSFPRRVPDRYEKALAILSTSGRLAFGAYTVGSRGHVALKVKADNRTPEPYEAAAEMSIVAECGAINNFGRALITFCKWEHLMLRWTPQQCELFHDYQPDL